MSRILPLAFASLAFIPLPASAAGTCATEVSRFQNLLDRDLKTGFVAKSVYAKASADLAKAKAACAAGRDGAASAAVHATRTRYGYP